MMVPTSRAYVRQAFFPGVFSGLGATAAEVSALAARVATGGGADVQKAYQAALTSYYSPGGVYSQAESVKTAAADEPGAGLAPPPSEMPAPMLYAAEECDVRNGACIARNAARQNANLALLENARRAFNLQVCEYNAAINPGQDIPCGQFRERVPVPAASGPMQTAVCAGGECYTPIVGDTGTVTEAQRSAQLQYAGQYTPSGVPKVPNQTVPPRSQPGVVPAGGDAGTGTRGTETKVEAGGLFAGLSTQTLLIGAAALAGVFLLARGKG